MFMANNSLVNCFYQGVSVKVPGGNRWHTQIRRIQGGFNKGACSVWGEKSACEIPKGVPTPTPRRTQGVSGFSRDTWSLPEEELWPLVMGPKLPKVTFQAWCWAVITAPPGPKSGLSSSTWKWIVRGDTSADEARDSFGKRCPGGE